MRVVRAEKQRHSRYHQSGGGRVLHIPALAQDWHSHYRSDKGSRSKESRLARRPQQSESLHVEHQAYPVTDES